MHALARMAIATASTLALVHPSPVAAVTPDGKTFRIAGTPPLEAIVVQTLSPTTRRAKRFAGAAALELSGSSPLALSARLAHKKRKNKGRYRFVSAAGTFPRFKGTIVTQGDPETVKKVRLVLKRGRRDKVTVKARDRVISASDPGATSGCFESYGDGTIRDTCTGLQWEQKRDDVAGSNLHDVESRYTWAGACGEELCQPTAAAAAACTSQTGGAPGCSECASGRCDVDPAGLGAVTTIWDWLARLNAAAFAGHTDWRFPWADELHVLRMQDLCSGGACIDPIFGATDRGGYWSATSANGERDAFIVFFISGSDVNDFPKTLVSHVRAVRPRP